MLPLHSLRHTRKSYYRTSNSIVRGHLFLICLAPRGVCLAIHVTMNAVSSYLAISTLPNNRRYIFCCTFRRLLISCEMHHRLCVTKHAALWSSDFPHRESRRASPTAPSIVIILRLKFFRSVRIRTSNRIYFAFRLFSVVVLR